MLDHLEKLAAHIEGLDSGSKDAAAIRYALARLGHCETSLTSTSAPKTYPIDGRTGFGLGRTTDTL